MKLFCLRGLKRSITRSLTAQISLSIAAVSIALVAGSGLAINYLAARELREGNELILFANLALLREDLAVARFDLTHEPHRLVKRMDLQLGNLHMALLDAERRPIAQSEHFEIPLSALPAQAMSVDNLPTGIEPADVRALGKALGPLTTVWTAADGRSFRLLFARIPVPPGSLAGPATRALLVVFAYELTQTRQIIKNEVQIAVVTLVVGALASGLLGVWIARRIVAGPRGLAAAANRISAQPMSERLSVARTPTELVDSTLAFNRMLDRLEASFKRLSEFSSDLAHDLRTPINNLLGEAQVALSKPRSAAEYRAVLESAVEDYERISRLIENMLFLARADDPHAATNRRRIDLQPVLERGRGYFEMLAEERGVTLEIDMQGAEPAWQQAWADETLFIRALGNLVSNALRYAPRGSRIVVSTTPYAGGGCMLEVSNDGPPIAPEHQQRIFERSFRVDESRAGSATGSGLGLAIVKSVMDLHGGTATVISGEGRRTMFRLWFPGPSPVDAETVLSPALPDRP
ncbi:MAG: heavy metal sensor histidine kinase [Rhizobiales bacterium]|nr:heavy metal sensor histidine kinase [Rhizobacter sp.]